MSCDRTTSEYHLTPNGWIEGTDKVYDHIQKKVEPPIDRVETWERRMIQSYSFSPEQVTWHCIWKSPDYTDKERAELTTKYPRTED